MGFAAGHEKRGGRKKGSLNKATRRAQKLAQEILTDEEYLKTLRERMIDDQPSERIEEMLWKYAFGKPRDPNVPRSRRPAPPSPETDDESRSE